MERKYNEYPRREKEPERNTVKISEAALMVNGKYIGEIGNPQYRDNPGMFVYNPDENTVTIEGTKETVTLRPNDYVRIPHSWGYVTLREVLGDKSGSLSGQEFERKLYRITRTVEEGIEKTLYLIDQLVDETKPRRENVQDILSKSLQTIGNKHPTPKEVLHHALEQIKEDYTWGMDKEAHEDFSYTLNGLKRNGTLSGDPEKSRDSIVSYTYMFCNANGIDGSNYKEIHSMLKKYRYTEELIREYLRQPDSRFGDAMLGGIEKFLEEDEEYSEYIQEKLPAS